LMPNAGARGLWQTFKTNPRLSPCRGIRAPHNIQSRYQRLKHRCTKSLLLQPMHTHTHRKTPHIPWSCLVYALPWTSTEQTNKSRSPNSVPLSNLPNSITMLLVTLFPPLTNAGWGVCAHYSTPRRFPLSKNLHRQRQGVVVS
jgi:hypothetical protein